jgi:hypothetical protein
MRRRSYDIATQAFGLVTIAAGIAIAFLPVAPAVTPALPVSAPIPITTHALPACDEWEWAPDGDRPVPDDLYADSHGR